MSFDWDKKSFPHWKDKVSYELMELRMHVAALEKMIGASGGIGDRRGKGAKTKESDFSDVSEFKFMREDPLGRLQDIEAPEGRQGSFTADLVNATYTIRTASTAMRGYLMLLNQAGLSPDQKKMIRELEYAGMMIMKLMVAVQLFNAARASMGDPFAIAQVIFAGGSLAASAAFGSKLTGGGV